jgi:IclR family KDG regulon transcriptional repressor
MPVLAFVLLARQSNFLPGAANFKQNESAGKEIALQSPGGLKKKNENAIEKAVRILASFAPQNKDIGTSDLSALLGYSLATTSRTLHTLKRSGLLQQNAKTKLFRLGPAISQLAAALHRSLQTELIQIAKPHVDLLCETVGSAVSIEVLSSDTSVVAYTVLGSGPIQVRVPLGSPLPAHAAAGAKAILAFSSPETVAGFVKRGLTRFTEYTITDAKAFMRELDGIRKRGYSTDRQEIHLDLVAVAAPILESEGEPVAAVVIAGPIYQLDNILDSTLADHVKSTAQNISSELYHNDDGHALKQRVNVRSTARTRVK